MGVKQLSWQRDLDRKKLVIALQQGDVAICSTDTILGFLAETSLLGYTKICELKQIETPRSFIVLIDSRAKIDRFVNLEKISDRIIRFLDLLWPSPVTVIFPARPDLPAYLTQEETIALRCPDHKGLLSVLSSFDGLFSTSANRTVDPPPVSVAEINPDLLSEVSYLVTDEQEIVRTHSTALQGSFAQGERFRPSTLIKIIGDEYVIVRQGVYPAEKLKELYEKTKEGIH